MELSLIYLSMRNLVQEIVGIQEIDHIRKHVLMRITWDCGPGVR